MVKFSPFGPAPYFTPVQEEHEFVVHRHAQSRMYDYGIFWNFERFPELNGLPVESFLGPNPVPKTVRRTLVGRNRTNNAHFFRFARFAMPRTNQGQPERQKAKGAWSAPPHPDLPSWLAAEQATRGTGSVFA